MNDTTTLDAAVDSLLAPQGEAPETSSEELVEEMIETPDDDQDDVIDDEDTDEDITRHHQEYDKDGEGL